MIISVKKWFAESRANVVDLHAKRQDHVYVTWDVVEISALRTERLCHLTTWEWCVVFHHMYYVGVVLVFGSYEAAVFVLFSDTCVLSTVLNIKLHFLSNPMNYYLDVDMNTVYMWEIGNHTNSSAFTY